MRQSVIGINSFGEPPREFMRNGVINRGAMYRTLVDNGIMRADDTRQIEETLVRVARRDLAAIRRVREAGLTIPLNNIGITSYEYDRITPVGPATQSMSILAALGMNDLVTFGRTAIPVPVSGSSFRLDARQLAAGRQSGQGLDTTNMEEHTRSVVELMEDTLVNGSPIVLGANTLPGYTNFAARHQLSFSNGPWGSSGWAPADGVRDIVLALQAQQDDGYTGPYDINIPKNFAPLLAEDYKANGDRTFKERLMAIDGIQAITVVAALPDDEMTVVQMTQSVVGWADAQDLTVVTWDEKGGLGTSWAVLNVGAPVLKKSYARGALSQGDLPSLTESCGIVHIAG